MGQAHAADGGGEKRPEQVSQRRVLDSVNGNPQPGQGRKHIVLEPVFYKIGLGKLQRRAVVLFGLRQDALPGGADFRRREVSGFGAGHQHGQGVDVVAQSGTPGADAFHQHGAAAAKGIQHRAVLGRVAVNQLARQCRNHGRHISVQAVSRVLGILPGKVPVAGRFPGYGGGGKGCQGQCCAVRRGHIGSGRHPATSDETGYSGRGISRRPVDSGQTGHRQRAPKAATGLLTAP